MSNSTNLRTLNRPSRAGSDPHEGMGSFQSLLAQGRELFLQSSEIQAQMAENRKNRSSAQRQVSDAYRVLVKGAESQEQLRLEADLLSGMRRKILDLEKEYVRLNQLFIAVQSQLREVISEQRYKLVESINITRARTAPSREPVALIDREPANDSDFLTKLLYGDQDLIPMKKLG